MILHYIKLAIRNLLRHSGMRYEITIEKPGSKYSFLCIIVTVHVVYRHMVEKHKII